MTDQMRDQIAYYLPHDPDPTLDIGEYYWLQYTNGQTGIPDTEIRTEGPGWETFTTTNRTARIRHTAGLTTGRACEKHNRRRRTHEHHQWRMARRQAGPAEG